MRMRNFLKLVAADVQDEVFPVSLWNNAEVKALTVKI